MAIVHDWVKMYRRFATSSIMECSIASRYFFQTAIIISDSVGVFTGTHQALARQFNMAPELVAVCLEELGQPDPTSNHSDHDGRRIVKTGENEYLVVTKMDYNPDPTNAERQARYRLKRKELLDKAVTIRNGSAVTVTAVTEDNARGEERRVEEKKKNTRQRRPASVAGFDEFWEIYPRKKGKAEAIPLWKSMTQEERDLAAAAVKVYADAYAGSPPDRRRFIPHGDRWLRGKRWEDDPAEWRRDAGAKASSEPAYKDWKDAIREFEENEARLRGPIKTSVPPEEEP